MNAQRPAPNERETRRTWPPAASPSCASFSRAAFLLWAVLALLVLPSALVAQSCRIESVDPDTGKVGDTIGATGESIGKATVEELYLTDGTNDFKVPILEQSDTLIKFKVPATVKPGRYSLMIKTGGKTPKLLEQPVKMNVET
jgi:hypothetical protein